MQRPRYLESLTPSSMSDFIVRLGEWSMREALRQVVAEGVEDPEHGMLLICMGCHAGQGFGISRAMAADAVLGWAHSYRASGASGRA
jgi:EAL domain-containing protein (putative c-di-GMP-specific phosphodiesterase class I)